jgi:hypothetical protein
MSKSWCRVNHVPKNDQVLTVNPVKTKPARLGAGEGDALEGARRLAGRGHGKMLHL